jgi:hypothetical protein
MDGLPQDALPQDAVAASPLLTERIFIGGDGFRVVYRTYFHRR